MPAEDGADRVNPSEGRKSRIESAAVHRGDKAMVAIPAKQSKAPTASQIVGRTPSTAQSHTTAVVTYTPPYAA